jgi:ferredoxin
MVNGLALIDPGICVGCGACVSVCPKAVLTLVPVTSNIQVMCSSKWRGPDVKRVCKSGCIGCGICARTCKAGAITVEGNLARIDPGKCTNCGDCAAKCPVKCIECVVLKSDEERKIA